jgi:hypothetical protein
MTLGLGSSLADAFFYGDYGAEGVFFELGILFTLSAAFLICSSTPLCGLSFPAGGSDGCASGLADLAGADGFDGLLP